MISNFPETTRSVSFNAPQFVNAIVATGAAQAVTIPATSVTDGVPSALAVLSATGNFYARFDGGSAAVPAANVTDGTASILNPTYLRVWPAMAFSVIATAGTIITIAIYGE